MRLYLVPRNTNKTQMTLSKKMTLSLVCSFISSSSLLTKKDAPDALIAFVKSHLTFEYNVHYTFNRYITEHNKPEMKKRKKINEIVLL